MNEPDIKPLQSVHYSVIDTMLISCGHDSNLKSPIWQLMCTVFSLITLLLKCSKVCASCHFNIDFPTFVSKSQGDNLELNLNK